MNIVSGFPGLLLVVTSAIELGVMNILTGLPDLSLAWTEKEFGMTFTSVKPDSSRFVVSRCAMLEAHTCAAFESAFAAKLNVGSAKAIAATEAAVSTAVAIKGVVFIARCSWNFSAPILNLYGKPAEDRLVPENRQMNEN
jgi:hypothetical protein